MLKAFLLPPGSIIVLIVAGLVLRRWRPRTGMSIVVAGLVLLYALSTPLVAGLAMRGLEPYPALDPHGAIPDAGAIVVLAAGWYSDAPEYGETTIDSLALTRLRYAATLHRRTGRPILVSGGLGTDDRPALADLMSESLHRDFGIDARWVERESRNTAGNAERSAEILLPEGIGTIYLVTHAWHMRRAVPVFEAAGFTVVPAPTAFAAHHPIVWPGVLNDYLPSPWALGGTAYAVHEWLGQAWYALRYG